MKDVTGKDGQVSWEIKRAVRTSIESKKHDLKAGGVTIAEEVLLVHDEGR